MSVTASNYHFPSNGWCNGSSPMMMMATSSEGGNVDDGLTSLSWLQNLNMCMTRLGAPTPPTPPASPINSINSSVKNNNNVLSSIDIVQCNVIPKFHSSHCRDKSQHNGHCSSKKLKTIEEEIIDYKTDGSIKPPYSYATLICMAMKANKNKMTLSAIYKWIRENFLYYKNADPSWQNSIRHNLSLNKCFIKIPRNKDEPGKGGFWRLDPVYADSLVDGVFKKRRPSHKVNNNNSINSRSTTAPFRKKSRKKELINGLSVSSRVEHKNIAPDRNDKGTTLNHDTPPNSAESYKHYAEVTEVVELTTAVNSIEQVGHCSSYAYTMHPPGESNLIHQGYADEVCITTTASEACMLGAGGNEICWNAILTDADLNELVDPSSYAPAIHSVESVTAINDSNATTAQLTAVEPQTLHLVTSSPRNNVIEETELFSNGVQQINEFPICSEVISATQNVVTCVNPSNAHHSDWNHWSSFPILTQPTSDVQIRQIGVHGQLISNSTLRPQAVAYVTSSSNRIQQSNSVNGAHPSSPNSAQFEHATTLQPWAECKAALEAAALDLENFGDLDPVQAY